jgi:hypothetical protein
MPRGFVVHGSLEDDVEAIAQERTIASNVVRIGAAVVADAALSPPLPLGEGQRGLAR